MGMCLEEVGVFSIEMRRESFIVHTSEEGEPDPEYLIENLDDLISALLDAREYLKHRPTQST